MQTAFNVIWLLLAGIWLAISYLLAALIQSITIIGIPFAIQSLKLAGYALWPFGRVVIQRQERDVALSCLGNAVWFVLSGFWLALIHLFTALLLFLTIIGIPLAIANVKMASLALAPFGKRIVNETEAKSGRLGTVVIVSDFPKSPG